MLHAASIDSVGISERAQCGTVAIREAYRREGMGSRRRELITTHESALMQGWRKIERAKDVFPIPRALGSNFSAGPTIFSTRPKQHLAAGGSNSPRETL